MELKGLRWEPGEEPVTNDGGRSLGIQVFPS